MSEQATRFIGNIPEHYDSDLGPLIFNAFAVDLANKVAALSPVSVLELAAGTGIFTRELRNRLSADCALVATDLNVPMLEVAHTKFADNERLKLEYADAMGLDYPDDSVDVIACQFGVMFFPDKIRSYEEALRVLKPGGSYLFNTWGSWLGNPFARIAHEVVTNFFPDNPPGFYKVPFHYHDGQEIESDLQKAGFAKVGVNDVFVTSEIPSAKHFANGLVFGNHLIEEIADRGGNPDDIVTAIANAIDDELGSCMPLHALVIKAVKAG